ncbi:hypothetical protein BV22DRAFT_1050018 [Leucogyrophana mollusca]|uniref:Uncharacterized protein n=1 Tax=Leucogyrophana mollusca TaxID=85980 RepID=A0ACB8B558_9AGAM|nr:hypothetical protein BV22DRAFT_1050018 [Leucogyrophana mollusca]
MDQQGPFFEFEVYGTFGNIIPKDGMKLILRFLRPCKYERVIIIDLIFFQVAGVDCVRPLRPTLLDYRLTVAPAKLSTWGKTWKANASACRDRHSSGCLDRSANNYEFLCASVWLEVRTRVSWIALVFISSGDNVFFTPPQRRGVLATNMLSPAEKYMWTATVRPFWLSRAIISYIAQYTANCRMTHYT